MANTPQKFDILDGLQTSGNVVFDTDTLFIDATNHRVGIEKTDPGTALDVNGTITSTNLTLSGLSQDADGVDALVIDSGIVGYRTLGTQAFSSVDNDSKVRTTAAATATYYLTMVDTAAATQEARTKSGSLYFTSAASATDDLLYLSGTFQSGVKVKTPKIESGVDADTNITLTTDDIKINTAGAQRIAIDNTSIVANAHITTQGYKELTTNIAQFEAGTPKGRYVSFYEDSSNATATKATVINFITNTTASSTQNFIFENVPSTGAFGWTIKITNGASNQTHNFLCYTGDFLNGQMTIKYAEGVKPPESTGAGDIDIYNFYAIDGVVYVSLSIRNAS